MSHNRDMAEWLSQCPPPNKYDHDISFMKLIQLDKSYKMDPTHSKAAFTQ